MLIAGQKREEVWNRLPFKDMKSLLILPDGNLLLCSWRDGCFWTWAIIEEIYHFKTYDRLFEPKEDFTVVDVGAHIGVYTLRVAKKLRRKGLLIAIEPNNENYQILVKNIKINGCKNVVPVNLALSNFERKAKFYLKSLSIQHSLQKKIDLETRVLNVTEVTVTTLTKLLGKLRVETIDLLKVDVEGLEYEVLKGSEELLVKHRISRLTVAAYHTSEESWVMKEYLEKFGYKVKIVKVAGRKYLYALSPLYEKVRV